MTDDKSAIERLREGLDEHGVEHYDHENGEPLRVPEKAEEPATSWRVDGASYCAVPDGKGTFDVWIDHVTPEQLIAATVGPKVDGSTSDGYHTFDELYEHRTGLLASLCNLTASCLYHFGLEDDLHRFVFKSWHHHDGDMYDGMFIVGINCAQRPNELAKWATWHCEGEWWDRFDIPELDRAPEWDGHTPADALERVVGYFAPREGDE